MPGESLAQWEKCESSQMLVVFPRIEPLAQLLGVAGVMAWVGTHVTI